MGNPCDEAYLNSDNFCQEIYSGFYDDCNLEEMVDLNDIADCAQGDVDLVGVDNFADFTDGMDIDQTDITENLELGDAFEDLGGDNAVDFNDADMGGFGEDGGANDAGGDAGGEAGGCGGDLGGGDGGCVGGDGGEGGCGGGDGGGGDGGGAGGG